MEKHKTIIDPGPFYHGTKANLKPGGFLEPNRNSNYDSCKRANFIYLTATLDAAKWGAELAVGDGPPTRSYRTRQPLLVIDEILDWEGHSEEDLRKMKEHLEDLKRQGIEAINE